MNADNLRKVPADAPTAFIKPRWKPLVITPEGLDRRFYEICALSELKNALRSGDIWVKGSRQFRDFDDYLLPAEKFAALKREIGRAHAELQSLMRISYAVFCLKNKNKR